MGIYLVRLRWRCNGETFMLVKSDQSLEEVRRDYSGEGVMSVEVRPIEEIFEDDENEYIVYDN